MAQAKHVFCEVRFVFKNDYRGFLHDVTSVILYWWFARDVTAAILVFQSSPVGVENLSYVKRFLLFTFKICVSADHVSENALLQVKLITF